MTTVEYLHLRPGEPPAPVGGSAPFQSVVVIEAEVSAEWRGAVSEWLVRSGCLYMMAWGAHCSSWDDSVDLANLSAFEFGEIPDQAFVMTTWHENEPLSEAFWFAVHCATHPTVAIDRTIIVHIAASARQADLLQAFEKAQAETD